MTRRVTNDRRDAPPVAAAAEMRRSRPTTMSNALHYKSNLRDLLFNLFEVNDIGNTVLGRGGFANLDDATARDILAEVDKLARTTLAASFYAADREPLRQDDAGNVLLPAAVKQSLQAYYDAGFGALELGEHLGGPGAPPSVIWAAFELIAGANPVVAFYLFGSFIAKIIDRLGTPAQKRRLLAAHVAHNWGGTMVLTEPDAGSDVGAGRAKAVHVADDLWEITGTKRFITNGDYDGPANIIHLVLARPEGADAGTKGLSLFIVPKIWVNEDGSLGDPNGVRVSKVEKKMGIKGSSTCELVFGDDRPARGFLMGNVHDGIRQMFHVIENARMAVGMKSAATVSTAYLNALGYAKERVQGPDLLRAADKRAPRVRIIEHPDVRRMLLSVKAHAEGMRALAFFTAHLQDQVELLGGHGGAQAAEIDCLNDLMLPLVKGWNSERGYEQLGIALQIIGGSGYVQDYPFEQYIRDQKIDSLYEGTTHIQALDLIFRKIAKDGGATLQALAARIQQTIESAEGGDDLAAERAALARALGDINGMLMALLGKLGESAYHVGLQGNRVLLALADTVVGWLLIRHAAVALARAPKAKAADRAYFAGKVASARWWTRNVLPSVTLARKMVEASDLTPMEVDEEAL